MLLVTRLNLVASFPLLLPPVYCAHRDSSRRSQRRLLCVLRSRQLAMLKSTPLNRFPLLLAFVSTPDIFDSSLSDNKTIDRKSFISQIQAQSFRKPLPGSKLSKMRQRNKSATSTAAYLAEMFASDVTINLPLRVERFSCINQTRGCRGRTNVTNGYCLTCLALHLEQKSDTNSNPSSHRPSVSSTTSSASSTSDSPNRFSRRRSSSSPLTPNSPPYSAMTSGFASLNRNAGRASLDGTKSHVPFSSEPDKEKVGH